MNDEIKQLFLILNLKSMKYNTTYNYQVENVFDVNKVNIYPRQRILKYVGGKLSEKIFVNGRIETIKFLQEEIKSFN